MMLRGMMLVWLVIQWALGKTSSVVWLLLSWAPGWWWTIILTKLPPINQVPHHQKLPTFCVYLGLCHILFVLSFPGVSTSFSCFIIISVSYLLSCLIVHHNKHCFTFTLCFIHLPIPGLLQWDTRSLLNKGWRTFLIIVQNLMEKCKYSITD